MSATQNTVADVNMKDAGFFKTWVDHTIRRDRRDFKIRRLYKSRSLFRGLLGFGWCTDIEKKLEIKSEYKRPRSSEPPNTRTQITLQDCMSNTPIQYVTDKHSTASFSSERKAPLIFINSNRRSDLLVYDGQSYARRQGGRLTQKYDKSGRLIALYDQNQIPYEIDYDRSGYPQKIQLATGESVKIKIDQNGKISRLVLPDKSIVLYFQSAEGDLTQVIKPDGTLMSHTYDELHNLTQIKKNQKTLSTIQYNVDRDWVTEVTDESGCIENYSYRTEDESQPLHYTSALVKKCKNQIVKTAKYAFWHARQPNGLIYLDRARIEIDGSTTEVLYQPMTGKIMNVSHRAPSRTTAFEKGIKGDVYGAPKTHH